MSKYKEEYAIYEIKELNCGTEEIKITNED